jgi:hypothetical protein
MPIWLGPNCWFFMAGSLTSEFIWLSSVSTCGGGVPVVLVGSSQASGRAGIRWLAPKGGMHTMLRPVQWPPGAVGQPKQPRQPCSQAAALAHHGGRVGVDVLGVLVKGCGLLERQGRRLGGGCLRWCQRVL